MEVCCVVVDSNQTIIYNLDHKMDEQVLELDVESNSAV